MQEIVVKITSPNYPKPFTAESISNSLRYGTLNQYTIQVEQVRESIITEAADAVKNVVSKAEHALHIGSTQNEANSAKASTTTTTQQPAPPPTDQPGPAPIPAGDPVGGTTAPPPVPAGDPVATT